jgi:hypothetical protein
MKKIWNKFILWGFLKGFWRGKWFIGTKDEAFKMIRKHIIPNIDDIEIKSTDIRLEIVNDWVKPYIEKHFKDKEKYL